MGDVRRLARGGGALRAGKIGLSAVPEHRLALRTGAWQGRETTAALTTEGRADGVIRLAARAGRASGHLQVLRGCHRVSCRLLRCGVGGPLPEGRAAVQAVPNVAWVFAPAAGTLHPLR